MYGLILLFILVNLKVVSINIIIKFEMFVVNVCIFFLNLGIMLIFFCFYFLCFIIIWYFNLIILILDFNKLELIIL